MTGGEEERKYIGGLRSVNRCGDIRARARVPDEEKKPIHKKDQHKKIRFENRKHNKRPSLTLVNFLALNEQ